MIGRSGPSALSWATEALHAASAIATAHRLGLLAALEAGPVSVQRLAADCEADPQRVRTLVDALVATGLVESTQGGQFRSAVPGLSVLGLLGAGPAVADHVVRTGRASVRCDVPVEANLIYPNVVTYLGSLLFEAAAAVAYVLAGADRVLDVGTGAAPWSLALACRDPSCRVTALDLGDVLEVTRHAVAAAGYSERFDFLAGDAFGISLPEQEYDLVLLGNVCHLFDTDANRRLLQRLRPSIRPGGRLAVIDVMPSPDPDAERSVRLYAVGLMARTNGGAVYSAATYQAWLEGAGYRDTDIHEASKTPPVTVVSGQRAILDNTAESDGRARIG